MYETQSAVKRFIYGVFGVSWGVGTGCGGVLMALVAYFVVSELRPVVQSGAEHEIRLVSTYVSTVTWH
jgi:uncharacterized membrane protein